MVWISLVLSVFLFYKFVEKKHKIIIFKIGGALFAIGAFVFGVFLGNEEYKLWKHSRGITVKWNSQYIELNKEISQKIVNTVFYQINDIIQSKYFSFDDVNKNILKAILLKKMLKKVYNDEYTLFFKTEEIEFVDDITNTHTNSYKRADMKIRSDGFFKRIISELPGRRAKIATDLQKAMYASYLIDVRDHFKNISLADKDNFLSKLLPEEIKNMEQQDKIKNMDFFSDLEKEVQDITNSEINSHNNLKKTISFEICNKLEKQLEAYSFYVSGFELHRSTAKSLNKLSKYDSSTRFESDIIIGPNKCYIFGWPGDYNLYISYNIENVSGTWKG